jgi:hypothetical protein
MWRSNSHHRVHNSSSFNTFLNSTNLTETLILKHHHLHRCHQHYNLFCSATGPRPLTKKDIYKVRSSASCFNFQYLLFSLRSSSSCLRLLRLLLTRSLFFSITCFRRQLLCKMRPIKLASFRFTLRRMS